METSTQDHYEKHLGRIYGWMLGDYSEAVNREKILFERLGFSNFHGKVAVDLGAGNGVQSLALEQMGMKVHSVDFSQILLAELEEHSFNIQTYHSKIEEFDFAKIDRPELVTCMGDTITHFDSLSNLKTVLATIHNCLASEGALILTYRDLSNVISPTKFIPVKSDAERILTCALEDAGEKVNVHDLVYELKDNKWEMQVSSYQKLKIEPKWLISTMEAFGFLVRHEKLGSGMELIIGAKKKPS